MEIKYEFNDETHECLTECPYGNKFRVGSSMCVDTCKHCNKNDMKAHKLECTYVTDKLK